MSEQPTYARTDELRPGDRVWHPFDIVCFTVAHEPKPETGLHFQGEPGLRVTGTNDRGETVHVDVAQGYKWLRGPIRDLETAVRVLGALPMPVAPEPEDGRLLDRVAELETEREKLVRWHGEDSEAITKLVARVERHRARLVALQNDALAMRGSLSPNGEDRKVPFPLGETLTPAVDWLIARVAELEAERHSTNEVLDDAIRALRNRDRVTEPQNLNWSGLGKKIAAARLELGWDQAELAGRSGNSLNTISNYERGRVPRGTRLMRGIDRVEQALGWPEGTARSVLWSASDVSELEQLRTQVAELKARLAEYERPVDEDPIAYALTGKAETGGA